MPRQRWRVTVRGVVQGVGFRPFVHSLARGLGLTGQVANTGQGVVAEVEGTTETLRAFRERVVSDVPPLAVVERVRTERIPVRGGTGFVILVSGTGPARTLVCPDVATCGDCLREMAEPADRRYRHPFITCTHCGPRFTIITSLPYDRANTTMARFPMCPDCAREYADPTDRRFHAQPVACPACGPTLRLIRPGQPDETGDAALEAARRLLAAGAVVAVKGLGGYHVACDATDAGAVTVLRKRKDRGDKPFAVMVADLATAQGIAEIDETEADLLTGFRRPVVLLRRRAQPVAGAPVLAEAVAPGAPDIGVLLPYTPVHHLLLGLPGDAPGPTALVMTSGNLAGEPIVTDDAEALRRLAVVADAWLTHDRPIHVPCDDSVLRVVDGVQLPVRRSRGYAPFPLTVATPLSPALAVGGDLKNTFCLGRGRYAWLSGHVGDMDDVATLAAYGAAEEHLRAVTGTRPGLFVADRHPRYRSGQWAARHADGRRVVRVQHHHAHIASAMAEHGHDGATRVLGVAFDGTGYGDDGAVWGGEFLHADYDGYQRLAHLSYVPLPGGDAAVRNPYRMALAHLHAAGLAADGDLPCVLACPEDERPVLARQLDTGLGCVPTSSMGRLFDAVSSLLGICHRVGYEAQAAIELEGAARPYWPRPESPYRFGLVAGELSRPLRVDPGPVLAAVLAELRDEVPVGLVAARFHRAVVDMVGTVVDTVAAGTRTVALSGGSFGNTLLTSGCVADLRARGYEVLRHRHVPPNDGGLALGQLVIAARRAVDAGVSDVGADDTEDDDGEYDDADIDVDVADIEEPEHIETRLLEGGNHVSGGTRQGAGDPGT
ncbi:MAG: carbamoyltransferase HypF [Actinocatenispora sp.]